MPNALQELRKSAGFDTAKAFAAEMGIPETTYARYERAPECIPLDRAWLLSDRLGCTIDEVVGHAAPDPAARRGEVQCRYDALNGQCRALVDEFLEFVESKNAAAAAELDVAERARYRRIAAYYEDLMYKELEKSAEEDPLAYEDLIFATAKDKRTQFEEFLVNSAEARHIFHIQAEVQEYKKELQEAEWLPVDEGDGFATMVYPGDSRFEEEVHRLCVALVSERSMEVNEAEGHDLDVVDKIMAAYDETHGGV